MVKNKDKRGKQQTQNCNYTDIASSNIIYDDKVLYGSIPPWYQPNNNNNNNNNICLSQGKTHLLPLFISHKRRQTNTRLPEYS